MTEAPSATRKKLPAYGKALLAERRAGRHPLLLRVVYGDDWSVPGPKICIKPADYQPGVFDLCVAAGLYVELHDRADGLADLDVDQRPPSFGPFFDLVRELVVAQACVEIRAACVTREAGELAFTLRWWDGQASRFQWPRWWDDELDARNHQRLQLCLSDLRQFTERERGAST